MKTGSSRPIAWDCQFA